MDGPRTARSLVKGAQIIIIYQRRGRGVGMFVVDQRTARSLVKGAQIVTNIREL